MDQERFLLWAKQISFLLVRCFCVLSSVQPQALKENSHFLTNQSEKGRMVSISSGIVVRDQTWNFEIPEDSDCDPSFSVP